MSTQDKQSALRIDRRGDVAILIMDVPGESMNTLKEDFTQEFAEAFAHLEKDASVKAIVFASGKKDSFIAGANIDMLDACKSAADAEKLSRDGQRAMDRIADFPKPVVAAIHGACLGGGLEVALACHARVASDSTKTKLGLPECQLGLLPGAGGTQRLPALIGVQAALDLLLTGKQVDGKKAKKLGFVDEVVPAAILLDVAVKHAEKLAKEGHQKKAPSFFEQLGDKDALAELALAHNPLGRKVLFDQARKALHKKTRGNYPAQDRILDVVKAGLEQGLAGGLDAEAKAFGVLVMSPESKALRSIFFATQTLKKDNGTSDPDAKGRKLTHVGMLGAGLMGAGIAYVTTAQGKTPVRLKDRDAKGVLAGLKYVREIVDERVKKKRMNRMDADQLMTLTTGTTDYSGFAACEVVIEAVFEDLSLKQQMVRDVAAANPNAIFASNTSSIPIAKIAEASAHPENVLGMHYFSPVHKMPLLEIIVTPKTSNEATVTCVELGKKQGKTVIVVNDGPGFYTTRILAPLMNEAAHLLAEGVAIEKIDRAMLDFGFPVGPIKLTDEVGIDVGAKVGKVMLEAFGDRMAAPAGMEKLIADDRKGRKNAKGFYLYGGDKKGVDESVYEVLGVKPDNTSVGADDIAWRCTLQMVNEAALCFQEGILRSARDGDIGAIFGLGFPPFRGGPFRFVDAVGAKEIVRRLRHFEKTVGARFAPAPLLVAMAEKNLGFHEGTTVSPGQMPR
ncbi:MAG: fatty acid oxidation complex subunit alpha FadJ [Sandaracinus sp.]|nr:fatty acid oxidation complex subunit alpha FadJ [Sandaracinus sp.]